MNPHHLWISICLLLAVSSSDLPERPNILLILSDDQGYQDAGFRGSDILTPNIDKLAGEGVVLENHYVMPQCSPTRASLMTGRHAIRNGFWKGNIGPTEEWGVRLNETLMPEMLRRNGYKTHGVGKWHCGFFSWKHTPAQRGFDTFLGGFLGAQKYFTHKRGIGFDLREDFHDENGEFVEKLRRDLDGKYNTDIFTDQAVSIISEHDQSDPLFLYLSYTAPHHPFQVSNNDLKQYAGHIAKTKKSHKHRKTYAAMVSVMDRGIGQVVGALEEQGMRDNTIIVFFSDNGAVVGYPGSNYPLRGGKHGLGEGAVRALSFVNSPMLATRGYTNKELFHVTDWYKTFQDMAGDKPDEAEKVQLTVDGLNVWNSISNNAELGREDLLINMRSPGKIDNNIPDPVYSRQKRGGDKLEVKTYDFFVIRHKNWKLYSGEYLLQGWISENRLEGQGGKSEIVYGTRLYNLDSDPREENDVSESFPDLVATILAKRALYEEDMTVIGVRSKDPKVAKKKVWYPWVEL